MPTFIRALDAEVGHPVWQHIPCGTTDAFADDTQPYGCTGCKAPDLPHTWRPLFAMDGPAEPEPLPVGELLEAVHVGLTAEQEIRARALTEAVSTLEPVDLESALVDIPAGATPDENLALTVEMIWDCVRPLASRYAAWIADGDPAAVQDGAPTKLYVAMVNDRHTDAEAYVFSTPEAAIEYARGQAHECARTPADVEEEPIDGWLYHARYSGEGDSVWVLEKTLGEGAGA